MEVFVILDQGDEVVTCTFCGSRLRTDITKKLIDKAKAEGKMEKVKAAPTTDDFLDELASAMEIEEADVLEPAEAAVFYDGALGTVLIADDEQLVRNIISDIFVDQGVASQVINCSNGGEMVKKFNELLASGDSPIGLLVVDLEMPVLNGLQTAMTIRKIEQSRELMPVPILFFSGRKREPRLDDAMKKLRPSMYMYKGEGKAGMSAEQALRERVRKVVGLLMQEMNA